MSDKDKLKEHFSKGLGAYVTDMGDGRIRLRYPTVDSRQLIQNTPHTRFTELKHKELGVTTEDIQYLEENEMNEDKFSMNPIGSRILYSGHYGVEADVKTENDGLVIEVENVIIPFDGTIRGLRYALNAYNPHTGNIKRYWEMAEEDFRIGCNSCDTIEEEIEDLKDWYANIKTGCELMAQEIDEILKEAEENDRKLAEKKNNGDTDGPYGYCNW